MKLAFKDICFFFIGTLICYSCNSQSLQLAEANKEYREEVSKFDKAFVGHFPTEIESFPFSMVVSNNRRNSHPGIWLKLTQSTEELDALIDTLSLQAKAIYTADDSCLMVIDKHLTEDNRLDYDKTLRRGPEVENIDSECNLGKLPVPKFWSTGFIETDKTATGLTKEDKLYVLEAEPGIFMDENKLPNGKYTPKGWEHGYSRGIALNEKTNTVLYWFDIW